MELVGLIIFLAFLLLIPSKKSRFKNNYKEYRFKSKKIKSEFDHLNVDSYNNTVKSSINHADRFPYYLVHRVLSENEKNFYQSLMPITNKLDLIVFTKMRVADLVYVPKNHPDYMKWFNYIKAKHIDFIICNKRLCPVLLIELDDSTHDRLDNKKRDEFKDKIFNQLLLPILRIRRWEGDELESQIKNALGVNDEVATQT